MGQSGRTDSSGESVPSNLDLVTARIRVSSLLLFDFDFGVSTSLSSLTHLHSPVPPRSPSFSTGTSRFSQQHSPPYTFPHWFYLFYFLIFLMPNSFSDTKRYFIYEWNHEDIQRILEGWIRTLSRLLQLNSFPIILSAHSGAFNAWGYTFLLIQHILVEKQVFSLIAVWYKYR